MSSGSGAWGQTHRTVLLLLAAVAVEESGAVHHKQPAIRLPRPRRLPNEKESRKLGSVEAAVVSCGGKGLSSAARLQECLPCHLNTSNEAPRMFIKETSEGFGSRFFNIISAMALAAKHGMSLGAVISFQQCKRRSKGLKNRLHHDPDHGEDILRLVSGVLGLQEPSDLFTENTPEFKSVYWGVKEFESNLDMINPGDTVFFRGDYNNGIAVDLNHVHGGELSEYITPSFLQALRRPGTEVASWSDFLWKPRRLRVAMHIRRGDILLDHRTSRETSDEWYFTIAERLWRLFPRADVHAFSSTLAKDFRSGRFVKAHNDSAFDGYRSRGIAVHLDGDVLEAWAHFAHADILVIAKSAFSHVAAYLNPNCVLYQKWYIRPLPGWINAFDGVHKGFVNASEWGVDEKALRACVAGLAK